MPTKHKSSQQGSSLIYRTAVFLLCAVQLVNIIKKLNQKKNK